ncbi:MAG: uracil-DNA glycosylase family protein, partial [Alphaproteobacteria bacterium]
MTGALDRLLEEVRACRHCEAQLPFPPKPVLRASSTARILIVGQAPGTRVHESGVPWNDASGEKLREWLDLDRETFYDESRIAIV